MMNKEQKKQYITDMTNQFDKTEAVIVTHYQGLTVNQLDDLRKRMREHGIKFKITKNRITKLALEKTKCKDLSNLFKGPTAVALSEDAITSAKILTNSQRKWKPKNFRWNHGADILDVAGVQNVATLPTLDEAAKIVGILKFQHKKLQVFYLHQPQKSLF